MSMFANIQHSYGPWLLSVSFSLISWKQIYAFRPCLAYAWMLTRSRLELLLHIIVLCLCGDIQSVHYVLVSERVYLISTAYLHIYIYIYIYDENRITRDKPTWPSVSRTWLSHL